MILRAVFLWRYCWWKKSCTSWYGPGKYPSIYRFLCISADAVFLPSTVFLLLNSPPWRRIPSTAHHLVKGNLRCKRTNAPGSKPLRAYSGIMVEVHPGRLTWNLKTTHLKWKNIFQTIIFRFYVNLWGCSWQLIEVVDIILLRPP